MSRIVSVELLFDDTRQRTMQLPNNKAVIVGGRNVRCEVAQLPDKQILLVANYAMRAVNVMQLGASSSVVDGVELKQNITRRVYDGATVRLAPTETLQMTIRFCFGDNSTPTDGGEQRAESTEVTSPSPHASSRQNIGQTKVSTAASKSCAPTADTVDGGLSGKTAVYVDGVCCNNCNQGFKTIDELERHLTESGGTCATREASRRTLTAHTTKHYGMTHNAIWTKLPSPPENNRAVLAASTVSHKPAPVQTWSEATSTPTTSSALPTSRPSSSADVESAKVSSGSRGKSKPTRTTSEAGLDDSPVVHRCLKCNRYFGSKKLKEVHAKHAH